MHSDALQLLESRLARLKADHVNRLLAIGASALGQFDPMRKITFGTSLGAYAQTAVSELCAYATRIRDEVLSLVGQILLPLSEQTKNEVLAVVANAFDETLYPSRIVIQEESMIRHGGRYGLAVDEWGIRTDLERAKHHAGTANLIRRSIASLTDELELVRLRSSREVSASLISNGGVFMPFSDLMNDKIDVLKSSGSKVAGLKASVQRNKIFMDAGSLVVEPSDLIIRRMSNGAEETYRVIDPGFHEAFHGIKAHYQMDVQKLGLPEAKSAVQSITYNITGPNVRINQNSVDNSTNIVQIDARAIQHIQDLRTKIEELEIPEVEKSAAREVVDEVEEAFKSGKPKKSVVSALLKSLPHIANIASIVTALVGLL